MDFIIYFTLALFVTTMLLLIAGSIGDFLVRLYYTIDNSRIKRKLSVYGYRIYYLDYKDISKDATCLQILPFLKDLYIKESSFNAYCVRLSEDRLPINVMLNWARSVAEDVFAAPIPSIKMDQWNHYWKSKIYTRMTFFHADFPKYEEFEMGCLWGTVYLWLTVFFEKDTDDPLMLKIVQLVSKNKTAIPYFSHLYNAARKLRGENFYLPNNESYFTEDFSHNEHNKNYISSEDVYNGFEPLSVDERCHARKVLNDLLADCSAWKTMLNEMKARGWFKQTIYPMGETKYTIYGDYVLEKNVENEVGNVESDGIGISKSLNDE